jgi:hypothetical protein
VPRSRSLAVSRDRDRGRHRRDRRHRYRDRRRRCRRRRARSRARSRSRCRCRHHRTLSSRRCPDPGLRPCLCLCRGPCRRSPCAWVTCSSCRACWCCCCRRRLSGAAGAGEVAAGAAGVEVEAAGEEEVEAEASAASAWTARRRSASRRGERASSREPASRPRPGIPRSERQKQKVLRCAAKPCGKARRAAWPARSSTSIRGPRQQAEAPAPGRLRPRRSPAVSPRPRPPRRMQPRRR